MGVVGFDVGPHSIMGRSAGKTPQGSTFGGVELEVTVGVTVFVSVGV